MSIGIYKITSPTNKVYIGQSINIESRWVYYKKYKFNHQWKLSRSIKKYGTESHLFEIVKICEIQELNYYERYFQEFYNCISQNGLNCKLTNTADKKLVHSIETRAKISRSNTGKKTPQERTDRIAAKLIGQKRSDLFKSELSTARLGNRNPMFGKCISPQSRRIQINKLSGELNYLSKPLINLETGIFYDCLREAAESCNAKKGTLWAAIVKYKKNNTPFVYA